MVSTAEMGVQTMTEKSENKTTSLQGEQNKLKPAKDELSEQDLNKVAGGLGGNLADAATPKLHEAACKGTHIPEVVIEV